MLDVDIVRGLMQHFFSKHDTNTALDYFAIDFR
jgi:hypothetical protein